MINIIKKLIGLILDPVIWLHAEKGKLFFCRPENKIMFLKYILDMNSSLCYTVFVLSSRLADPRTRYLQARAIFCPELHELGKTQFSCNCAFSSFPIRPDSLRERQIGIYITHRIENYFNFMQLKNQEQIHTFPVVLRPNADHGLLIF
jgi:hypothetical protein